MCWGDGTEYLHFSERQTKTWSGADPHNVRPIKPKAFPTPDLPCERDIVVVFKIYSEKRPESMNKPDAPFYLGVNHTTKNANKSWFKANAMGVMNEPDAPFYLGVNHTTKNSDKSWFKANAMGVKKLNSLMNTMAEDTGLDSSHLTNYSAWKRTNQTLNDKDIPSSHIMQLSGHKNVQSINNYSHVSQEQQESMSRILSGLTSMVQTETHSLVKTTKKESPTPTAAGLFKGTVFYRGNFTINISSSSSPTEEQKQQTYKRINRKLDSSEDDDSPPLTLKESASLKR